MFFYMLYMILPSQQYIFWFILVVSFLCFSVESYVHIGNQVLYCKVDWSTNLYAVSIFGLYIVHGVSKYKCLFACICICICIFIVQVWSVRCWSDPLIHCHALFLARSLNTDSLHRVNTRKTTTSSPRFYILQNEHQHFLASGLLDIFSCFWTSWDIALRILWMQLGIKVYLL